MNYFKILGLVFGLLAFLKPFYIHLLPIDEFEFINKAYQEKRPKWIVVISILGLLLVGVTWYHELITNYKYSIVITILFSFTAIKAIILLIDYEKFQNWVQSSIKNEKTKRIVFIDLLVSVLGLLLILLAILFL